MPIPGFSRGWIVTRWETIRLVGAAFAERPDGGLAVSDISKSKAGA